MLPLNDQKAVLSFEDVTILRFALNIFIHTDFTGIAPDKEVADAKEKAKIIYDKLTKNVNDFSFADLCVMGGAVDNLQDLLVGGETFNLTDSKLNNIEHFLPTLQQKIKKLVANN